LCKDLRRVICQWCGTEIADKALICYRCGKATESPKFKPAPLGVRKRRRSILPIVIVVVLAVLAVLLVLFLQ
jgi:hypothetical protein